MANIINASAANTGIIQTADASGILQLQANGVAGLTVSSGGLVTAANGILMSSMTLGTAVAGEFEYDGRLPYFTPLGTQRGVVPGMQYYVLNSSVVGSNATGAQNLFGVGCTLSSNTFYHFEGAYRIVKSAGTTSHTVSNVFGGTATLNSISFMITYAYATGGSLNPANGAASNWSATNSVVYTTALTDAAMTVWAFVKGIVSINAGGTFIPQYQLSAAPGGAYTTSAGSYFLIYPIGASGANINIGTWA
jgi:hypothetical protein